ncbi:MAG TPA: phosphatidylglycerophosphatase A [Spirochaetota bacterium]|nr:phosphatidylglycerophosphatase A [Spirochaetota bacterium]HNT10392.1 phosphatidylglycerophosphatase A [Spirochaetota bacterium]HOS39479.1 phosphatidylglycerophosphatase A [Spirochaetota bacterium]
MILKEILFTFFYSGYFPIASGTAGSVVAMGVYVLGYVLFGERVWIANLVLVALLFFPAIRIGDWGERYFGDKDPSPVVLDEAMGYWITVLFHPFSWSVVFLGFVIFRIMDIIKPFPARRLERLPGGRGIMIDDYIAGAYSNIVLIVIVFASRWLNCPI